MEHRPFYLSELIHGLISSVLMIILYPPFSKDSTL